MNLFVRKKALTLIEVLVATAIFTITFAGLMIGQKSARFISQGALIRFSVLQYSQGLLESIQSYDYDDPTDYPHTENNTSDSATAFGAHTTSFGDFDTSSGVYSDSGTLVTELTEEVIGLRYHPTSTPVTATSTMPFVRNEDLQINDTLLGPEEGDLHNDSNPATGIYKITSTQRNMNLFSYDGSGQEKYYFMDDVDDFDGYQEICEIMPDVNVTFEVSVTGIYGNLNDFTHTIRNADNSVVADVTINQNKYSIMHNISITNLQQLVPELLNSDDTLSQTQQLGYAYYNSMIMKKITIKATWEYPIGSGEIRTLVIDGTKSNPRGSAL